MTEADWLTGTDFAAQAHYATQLLSARRQRLLTAAFCRAVDHLIDHPELARALVYVELYADGRASVADVEKARQECRAIATEAHDAYARQIDSGASGGAANIRHELAWAIACAASTPLTPADVGTRAAQAAVQARTGAELLIPIASPVFDAATAEQALRMRAVVWEIVGNPFRKVDFAPWRTDTAVAIARQMYDSREFSAMPILADALQDAGCYDDDVLNHCRAPGEHVRGCWVVDAVLGKE